MTKRNTPCKDRLQLGMRLDECAEQAPGGVYYAPYLLMGLVFLGLMIELNGFKFIRYTLCLALIAACSWAWRKQVPIWNLSRDFSLRVLFSLSTLVPVFLLYVLFLTWNQDFPQSGDHNHHVLAGLSAIKFWKWRIFLVIGLAIVAFGLQTKKIWWWPVFIFLTFLVWSYADGPPPWYFARYPAGQYLLTYPFYVLADLFRWDSYLNASRIPNLLAVPIWLWILRPILVGARPNIASSIFGFVFFLNLQVLYYFQTAYLEAWACIFAALAVERVLYARRFRNFIDVVPILLVGIATWFKEQSILLIPVIALVELFRVYQKGSFWRSCLHLAFSSIVSAIPFLFYLRFRTSRQVFREHAAMPFSQALDLNRMSLFFDRLVLDFSLWFWIILFFGLLAVGFNYLKKRQYFNLVGILVVFGGLLFQIIFYWVDIHSIYWTGYARFLLIPLSGFVAAVFLSPEWTKPGLSKISRVLILATSIGVVSNLALYSGVDEARNFFEHLDAPIYYPVNDLLGANVDRLKSANIERIGFAEPRSSQIGGLVKEEYPGLVRNFKLEFPKEFSPNRDCECLPGRAVLMLLPVSGIRSRPALTDSEDQMRLACLDQISSSCSFTEKKQIGSELAGLLGWNN